MATHNSNTGSPSLRTTMTMSNSGATSSYSYEATNVAPKHQLHQTHQQLPYGIVPKQRFVVDLSQCLFDFVIQLLPTAEEMSVKEDVRKLLERLIRTIEPNSRLLSFGSTANGFSLRNSDMDLCCLIDSSERLSATDLVTMVGDLLERETKFHVKPLPHARIPIVKLSLDPSPGLPLGIACDIGFENRLALENTRLLMCYAMIDPTRVRTLVLFLKVWSKRRKINSPYKGTLSSYGYVLMVIYFLVHVKNPPVLPNLQSMPPMRPISKEDTHVGGHNTWFFDDIELLRQHWHSENTETVAELLIEFFRYWSRDFPYGHGVASIRAGSLKKDSKGWQNDLSGSRYADARERNRFCIEDPFEIDFNVARCVTKDGLYTIRGEFMRALRILQARPERAILALAELCEERKVEDLISAPPYPPPRPPPQTPYTVGSKPLRTKSNASPVERLSPPTAPSPPEQPDPQPSAVQKVSIREPPPEHMAPKRSKWTSPPPPEAPASAHALFEDQLEQGLELATANTEARECERGEESSNSEAYTDDDLPSDAASDDVQSVQSFTEGTAGANAYSPPMGGNSSLRRPSWLTPDARPTQSTQSPDSRVHHGPRGRFYRPPAQPAPVPAPRMMMFNPMGHHNIEAGPSNPISSASKRSSSGPPRHVAGGPYLTPVALSTPLPPSPESPSSSSQYGSPLLNEQQQSTVYYQTAHHNSNNHTARSTPPQQHQRPIQTAASPTAVVYPQPHHPGTQSPQFVLHYQQHTQQYHIITPTPHDVFPANLPPLSGGGSHYTNAASPAAYYPHHHQIDAADSVGPPDTPTPTGKFAAHAPRHTSSHSTTTITAATPPPASPKPSTKKSVPHADSSLPSLSPKLATSTNRIQAKDVQPSDAPKASTVEEDPTPPKNVQSYSSAIPEVVATSNEPDAGLSSSPPTSDLSLSKRENNSSDSSVASTSSSSGYDTPASRSPSPPHTHSPSHSSLSRASSAEWPATPTEPPLTATQARQKEYSSSLATLNAEETVPDIPGVTGTQTDLARAPDVQETTVEEPATAKLDAALEPPQEDMVEPR